MEFCGEITYDTEKGGVHSDIGVCSNEEAVTDDYRQFLHNCLDEWLNKSNGTGAFWVGDSDYFNDWGK